MSDQKQIVAVKGVAVVNDVKPKSAVPKKKGAGRCATFLSLWKYLTTKDYIVLVIGAIFAIAHGASMPLFALFFGDATNALGNPSSGAPQGKFLVIQYPASFSGTELLDIGEVSIKGYDMSKATVTNSVGFTDPEFPASNCIDGDLTTFCKSSGENPSLIITLEGLPSGQSTYEFSDITVNTNLDGAKTLAGANIQIVDSGDVAFPAADYIDTYFETPTASVTNAILTPEGALTLDVGYTHSGRPIAEILNKDLTVSAALPTLTSATGLQPVQDAWTTAECASAGCVFRYDVNNAARSTWTGTFTDEKEHYDFHPGDGFMDAMMDVVWKMGIIAGIVFVGGSVHTTCFTYIAERSAEKLRREYLTCILSRDMAWFDMNDVATIPSKLISQVGSFQDAIGDKFGLSISKF